MTGFRVIYGLWKDTEHIDRSVVAYLKALWNIKHTLRKVAFAERILDYYGVPKELRECN